MAEGRWDVPQTEAGLQTLLARLEESRAAGNEGDVGYGLLALARLVVWTRSDNDEPPFARAGTLATEAIGIFRCANDEKGLLLALRAPASFLGREEVDRRLDEAMEIAERLGDEREIARTLAARGRAMGIRDRAEATRVNTEALRRFRKIGDAAGQAGCLFSLCIGLGKSEEKYAFAKEASDLYRALGNLKMAVKCAMLAVMNGEEFVPWVEMEPLVRQGLADAIASIDAGMEAIFYGHLAKIANAKGDMKEAAEYLRRQASLKTDDGLSPTERRRREIDTTKMLLETSKASGNVEGIELWTKELKRLRRRRPDR